MRAIMYLVITIMASNGEVTTHTSQYDFKNMRECREMLEPTMLALVPLFPQMGEEVSLDVLECRVNPRIKVIYE